MKTRDNYILILLLFLLCIPASGKGTRRTTRKTNKHTQVLQIKQYEDSLRIYREKLQQAMAGNDSLRKALDIKSSNTSASADVASPLTFYHGVAQRSFGVDQGNAERSYADNAMMQAYINHPELVKDSEKNLRKEGDIAFKPSEPLHHDVDMTSQAPESAPAVAPAPVIPNEEVKLVAVKPNFWKFAGDYSLQFLQNYISGNWYKGGESNYSMIGAVTLQANYNDKDKIKWDNKLELKLGMQSSQGDTLHNYKSSEDLIRLTSKLGIQATSKWYYTLQGIVNTQFTRGYKANDEKVYSDFGSPLNVNLSLGMDYKVEWLNKHLTGTVNISPASVNFKYVDRLMLSEDNGLNAGKHTLWDFGSTFTADLEWKFSELVKWQTRLYGFTSYKRAEVEWENTITFQLSKYISTKIFIYPRFDDNVSTRHNDFGYFQFKEYWSMGFNYSF